MIDISSAKIDLLITHKVGNRSRDDGFLLSQQLGDVSSDVSPLILRNYIIPLAGEAAVSDFYHESDLNLNELRAYVKLIFADQDVFVEQSQNIARHLYAASSHSNITAGEMITVFLSDIRHGNESLEGIAVLRVEDRTSYLQVIENSGTFDLEPRTGISLSKVQKGVLILSGDLQIRTIDNLGKNSKYWLDDFIKCTPRLTPDAAVNTSAAIIKSLLATTESHEDRASIARNLSRAIRSNDHTTLKDIRNAAEDILGSEDVSKTIQAIERRTGITIPEEMPIDSFSVRKKSQSIMNRVSVGTDITVILKNSDASVSKATSIRNGNLELLTIEIDHAGNK